MDRKEKGRPGKGALQTDQQRDTESNTVNRLDEYRGPYSGISGSDPELARLKRRVGPLKPYRASLCASHGANDWRGCTCRSN
jgi:hypothetical protein